MKYSACQLELTRMYFSKILVDSLMEYCRKCSYTQEERPYLCHEAKCRIGKAIEKDGYTIPSPVYTKVEV